MTSTTPIDIPALLLQHSGDAHSALLSLATLYDQLVLQHAALQVDKERATLENSQLWRSLKSMGSSPHRSSGSRQNGDTVGNSRDTTSSRGTAALAASSLGTDRIAGLSLPLRRGPSSDNPKDHLLAPLGSQASSSSSSLRSIDDTSSPLTPPLPRARPTSQGSLRKAASLDIVRHQYPVAEQASERSIQTPPPPAFRNMAGLPSSASMMELSSIPPAPPVVERRYLPHIAPVSPLFLQHGQHADSPVIPSPVEPSVSILSTLSPTRTEYSNQFPAVTRDIPRVRSPTIVAPQPIVAKHPVPEPLPLPSFTSVQKTSPLPSPSAPLSPPPSSESLVSGRSFGEQQISFLPPLPPSATPEPLVQSPGSIQSFPSTPIYNGTDAPPAPRTPQAFVQPPTPPRSTHSPRPYLSPAFLPFCQVRIASSNINLNDKGKEVVSFIIDVSVTIPSDQDPGKEGGTASWRIEKAYNEVLGLDSAVKTKATRQESKLLAPLPDKNLFKDHSPHKSDQRKAILERYLQTLLTTPLRERSAICVFFNSDISSEPSSHHYPSGIMEGWLTKRGRNFGGWQTRYYVLSQGSLSYYETREGAKVGEINIQSASIGRQSSRTAEVGDDTYLHAFLIRTTKKEDKEQDDHILCAENDDARDAWVTALTTLQTSRLPTRPLLPSKVPSFESAQSTFSSAEDSAQHTREQSFGSFGTTGGDQGPHTRHRPPKRANSSDLPPSASLPSGLDVLSSREFEKRSTSELGQYPDMMVREKDRSKLHPAALSRREERQRTTSHPHSERPVTPEGRRSEKDKEKEKEVAPKLVASNVSSPMNAAPMPSGYDFKKSTERSKKTKSSFWNFSKTQAGPSEKAVPQAVPAPARPVFGVPLKEAVAISRIRPGLELPAVVYRCVEYLEAKNAESEEGIYRLSGSTNVIRNLKDRFNVEGDVNLLAADYFDIHAVSGLLKTFLRELPVHILTRELLPEFLQVIDLQRRKDRVNALGKLVARLPLENYCLFRFFFAHLCVIAQNAEVSRMNLRNLGIVFSPTLGMPAPLFSLLLSEFDLVFAVELSTGLAHPIMIEDDPSSPSPQSAGMRVRPNSEVYQASGAAQLMEQEGGNRLPDQVEDEEGDEEDSDLAVASGQDLTQDRNNAFSSSSSSLSTPRNGTYTAGLPPSPRPGQGFPTFATAGEENGSMSIRRVE